MISVSDSALDQLKGLLTEQTAAQPVGMRVYIQSGGCSGFSYGMGLDENPPKEDDQVVDVNGLRVYVDSYSAQYLEGAEIDYVENPRKEAAENDLFVENRQLLELGLEPIRLQDDLLSEVTEIAQAYSDRCDRSKIPARSNWIQRRERPVVPAT